MGTYTTVFRSYKHTRKIDMFRLFNVIGLPNRVAVPLVNQFYKWLQKNGPEWTVQRIKALKSLYLQHYAGNKAFRLDQSDGIKCHSDGTPYGPFRALWTSGTSRRMVNRVMTVLMSYSGIKIVGAPTLGQLKKFYSAVENPKPMGELPIWDMDRHFKNAYFLTWYESKFDTMEKWVSSSEKMVLYPPLKPDIKVDPVTKENLLDDYPSLPETSIAIDDHIALFLLLNEGLLEEFEPLIQKALGSHALPTRWRAARYSLLGFLQREMVDGSYFKTIFDWSRKDAVVGKIGFIQERGAKLRAVANPLRVVQVVLSRMNNWLSLVAQRHLPWDCTYDQGSGVQWASRKLAQGIKIYSFDLSNASDTIPLVDQLNFLKHVGPSYNKDFNDSLSFFEKVSKAQWFLKSLPNSPPRPLRWVKGQGLGIVCSFNAFAQTHGARLLHLCHEEGLESDNFVVLGDDVMVTEPLAIPYKRFMEETWGCEINSSKSITSEFLAEFASRLITRDGLVSSFKYPNSERLFSVWDPLRIPRSYGKRAMKLVPSRFRPMVQVMSTLPRPYGLGFKPDGVTVLPDSRTLESILRPITPKQVSDVAHATVSRRPHAAFQSWEVRSRTKVERYLDVEVAYAPSIALGTLLGKFRKIYRSPNDRYVPPCLQLSAEDLQWFILHRNENLENDLELVTSFDEYIEQVIKKYHLIRVAGPRTHPFEVRRGPKSPSKAFEKRLDLWLRTIVHRLVLFSLMERINKGPIEK